MKWIPSPKTAGFEASDFSTFDKVLALIPSGTFPQGVPTPRRVRRVTEDGRLVVSEPGRPELTQIITVGQVVGHEIADVNYSTKGE